ncbi:MAG TPA: FadD3 family acyl-CoA ligase [Nocardioidaceae bacterium]|nr:FadD3 family acyl-CoA ligase [Nocardioidaceae bacterium]
MLAETPPQTTVAALARAAQRFGEREAVVDGDVRMDFETLRTEVHDVARALIALDVPARARVAVWAPNTHHWMLFALAVHCAGGTLVPVNTRFTGHEALDVLARTRADVLAVPDRFLGADRVEQLRTAAATDQSDVDGGADRPVPGLPDLRHVVLLPGDGSGPAPEPGPGILPWAELMSHTITVTRQRLEQRSARVGPDDISDILFTSGTTGRSKGAMSTHRQAMAVADAWAECGELDHTDRYLVINPFFHSFGYKAGMLAALSRGATVIPQPTFDISQAMTLIHRERVTVLPGPPTIYQSMLDAPDRSEVDTSSLRLAVTGAAMVPMALVERMRRDLTFDTVLTAYGLTEAVVVTMCRPGDAPDTISRTSGRATAGFEIRIVDRDGRVLGPGENGEVLLRGPNVMQGYLDDPDATAEAVDDAGWLHTGDVGNLDERGYLTLTDRLKDVYTCGGFNVYPAEVEQTLAQLDGVVESAVVGVPDERLGEVGRAFVVVRDGAATTDDDIVAFCAERLANYKRPRYVDLVPDLPRNAGGKVLKRELRQRTAAQPVSATAGVHPPSDKESR